MKVSMGPAGAPLRMVRARPNSFTEDRTASSAEHPRRSYSLGLPIPVTGNRRARCHFSSIAIRVASPLIDWEQWYAGAVNGARRLRREPRQVPCGGFGGRLVTQPRAPTTGAELPLDAG